MNWPMIAALILSGLVFAVIIVFAAESDKGNAKGQKKRAFLPSKLFPWCRNADQLLVPLDDSEAGSTSCAPDIWPDHKQAFDLLYQSKELDNLLCYTPSHRRPAAWGLLWVFLGVALIALAIISRSEPAAACVFMVLGAVPLVSGVSDLLKFESSPLERLPAMVVDKSKRPYAGGDLMSGGVILLVCIETQGGDTQYCHIGLKLFRQIERGDIGVAYIKGEHMLDFKKITLKEA